MVSSHLRPIIIAGPTGSGKSSLALELAERHDGEIICADSRQFYRSMEIGTASPSVEEKNRIAHHGFNSFDPSTTKIDAGFFVEFAHEKIRECQARHKRPIIVGGTGLYLRSLRYGLSDVPPSDKNLIAELEAEVDAKGLPAIYEELSLIDPESVKQIMASDRYRIVRALEIYRKTGVLPSSLRKSFKGPSNFRAHWVQKLGNTDCEPLKRRVLKMIEEGLVAEACSLRGFLPADHWALQVMGYEEALEYFDGLISKDQMIERIFIRHRQYAKRQRTWFKRESYTWQIT